MIAPKILIMHQGAIGDFVLSLPALQTINNSFPGRAIEMLGYPATLSLAGSNVANAICSADWAPVSTLYGDFRDVAEQVRQYLAAFERVFIFSAQVKSVFIENVQRCHSAAVHIRTFPDKARHVVDYQLAQLANMGYAPARPVPQLPVSSNDRGRADDFLRRNDCDATSGPLIAVHAGSGSRHKCWPGASFSAVMLRLHEDRGAEFLLVEGPAEEQTAGEMTAALSALPCLALRNLDLPLVAALIARCAVFIGNDSGITHLAAAVGSPTVAVFGPTDPAVWGPRGKSVCIVRECDRGGQWRWPEPEAVLHRASLLLGG